MRSEIMKKGLAVVLAMALIFTACGPVIGNNQAKESGTQPVQEASETKEETAEEPDSMPESAAETEAASMQEESEEEDEASLELESFRSTASVAQMEITTGLTTEYLSYLCNFPVTVELEKETIVLKNLEDLDELGLEALYTEELIAAMKNCDTDKLEIQNGTMRVGDEDHYVILGTDENDVIGITTFHP